MTQPSSPESFGTSHIRTMLRQLLPGVILPGILYGVMAQHASVLVALAVASSVPLLDQIARVLQGKRPTMVGLGFIGFAGISIGLAMGLRSPMFILAKGAVLSAVFGLAFAGSAIIGRPLTRTLAVRLSTDHAEARDTLNRRWAQPKALDIFKTLSMGWGLLLLALATQQTIWAITLSPGMMMALDPLVHGIATVAGIVVSVLYVRKLHRVHPELGLLPTRVAA